MARSTLSTFFAGEVSTLFFKCNADANNEHINMVTNIALKVIAFLFMKCTSLNCYQMSRLSTQGISVYFKYISIIFRFIEFILLSAFEEKQIYSLFLIFLNCFALLFNALS